MIEPEHPTEDQILRRISFHESGAWWYARHGQRELAEWSKERADYWCAKLPARAAEAPTSTETAGLNLISGGVD